MNPSKAQGLDPHGGRVGRGLIRLRRMTDGLERTLSRALPGALVFGRVGEYCDPADYDFAALARPDGGVPRVVYQTWVSNSFGVRHRRSLRRFIARNPGFDFVFFDDAAMDAFMRREFAGEEILPIYEGARVGPCRTDIFRYAVLHRFGGFYFDIKSGADVPLDQLGDLDRPNAILGHESMGYSEGQADEDPWIAGPEVLRYPQERFLQWALGFSPGHPITARLLENIVRDYPKFRGVEFASPKEAILDFTGPRQFTRAVWECLRDDPELPFTECGINFDQRVSYSMPGGSIRFLQEPTYKALRDQVIVD